MSFARLPPVGNPILRRQQSSDHLPNLVGYTFFWLDSGTSSLAVAIMAARALRPEIAEPEVVIPGYGCPDLVAAALFAKVKPVLADIQASDPGYDLDSLKRAISPNTVAVVAVNFLGIKERLHEIQAILVASGGAKLIEDNAQWFPEPFGGDAMVGDFMCLSFGRGKPVSLLGGGACIVRNGSADGGQPDGGFRDAIASQLKLPTEAIQTKLVGAKVRAYNLLLNRYTYGLLSRLPFLGLGDTALHRLERVGAIDRDRQALLAANLDAYLQRPRVNEQRIHRVVRQFPRLKDIPREAADRCGRLLRYPLLCESGEQCERLYGMLEHNGRGASLMYRRALIDIPGITDKVSVPSPLVNSQIFAQRLLTLPTHQGVGERDIDALARIFNREIAQ